VHVTGRNLHIQAEARACPPVDPQSRPSLMSESRHVVFEPMSSVFGSVPGALTAGECAISCPPGTRLVHLRRVAAGANDYARRRVGLFVSNSQHWIVLRCRFVVVLASATALLFFSLTVPTWPSRHHELAVSTFQWTGFCGDTLG
jgi:hypothetical protein